jgi:hypothetical protein
MLAAVAGVAALAALFTFVPWMHAHGLYLRDAVRIEGQWWRLFTAMWVHLDTRHYLSDVAATAGLMLLAGREARVRESLTVLVICGLAAQLALLAMPAVGWYGGLSGAARACAMDGVAAAAGTRLVAPDWRGDVRDRAGQSLARTVVARGRGVRSVVGVRRGARRARGGAVAGLGCWLLQEWWVARGKREG